MTELSFFEIWRQYTRAKIAQSADAQKFSEELNKRIAETMSQLNCDKRTAIEDLMKK